ncbi:MAG: winged helix-turn-helix transcriptional regulator [Boseongicola sp. SB0667_bin_21]|nr:winged helix-turn-helix transcriptional regulator [Boseongicola sp. SB0667_bin_21]
MGMRKADMIDIKDILRQRHELGLTRNDIAAAVGVSAGTVSNVLRRAEAAGLSCWPLPDGLDDAKFH